MKLNVFLQFAKVAKINQQSNSYCFLFLIGCRESEHYGATINKTTACFSCKREVSLALRDAKAKRAKGKSEEAISLL